MIPRAKSIAFVSSIYVSASIASSFFFPAPILSSYFVPLTVTYIGGIGSYEFLSFIEGRLRK